MGQVNKGMKRATLLDKIYDGESLYDLSRDVEEAVDSEYNEIAARIPDNKDGYQSGTFRVLIEWVNE